MDRCLGTGAVPRQLEAQGYEVKCHESMFPPKERDDTNWLSLVGENNWRALSADKGIKRKQIERDALIEFRVRYFVFRNNKNNAEHRANLLHRHRRKISKILNTTKAPYIASITEREVRVDQLQQQSETDQMRA